MQMFSATLPRVLILSTLMAGCGYNVKPTEFSLGSVSANEHKQVQRIYIPVIDNLTTRTGAEGTITNALRESLAAVKGAEVVIREDEADFLLLAKLRDYSRGNAGGRARTGDYGSEHRGELSNTRESSWDINLTLSLEVELLERIPQSESRRRLWTRTFTQSGNYEASPRFSERDGSSSVSHIHRSREQVQLKTFAEGFARQIVDQVVQDF